MRTFPQPPVEACKNAGCALSAKSRALKACPCNLRKAFVGQTKAALKQQRVQFHPDKFSQVPEEVRASVQQAAREVFVVVDGLYQGS